MATNNQKRFAFNEDGTKMRASQSPSFAVNLGYTESISPAVLYHGTAEKNVGVILPQGLQKRKRQHVHLRMDKVIAVMVGCRHGKPVVLQIDAGQTHSHGYKFFFVCQCGLADRGRPAAYLHLL